MKLLSLLAMAIATPSPDLVALARAGQMPSFAAVLDARFDPAGDARFAAFKTWATTLSPEDRARWYEPIAPGPDGKPRWRAKVACAQDDSRGLAQAMAIVAGRSTDRATAQAVWNETEHAYADARTLEQTKLVDARAAAAKRPTETGRALAIRVASDQAWREAQFEREHDEIAQEAISTRFLSRVCHIDDDDTQFLKSVIAREGWPTMSRDGAAAANDAWLLAQHADNDPAFQRVVLNLMEPLVARKEAAGKDYALLFDRVALAEHHPQRYGTQFGEGHGGCMAVQPVEDHAGLDARRIAVGLDTLAEYGKRLSDAYHSKICTDIFDIADAVP